MEDVFGFKYEPNIYGLDYGNTHFYYITSICDQPIDVEGYDYFIQLSSWQNEKIIIDDLSISKTRDSYILGLMRDDEVLMALDTKEIALEIIDRLGYSPDDRESQMPPEEVTYEIEENGIQIKLIFTHISGYKEDLNIDLNNVEYILLVDDLSN